MTQIDIKQVIKIAQEAGRIILEIYKKPEFNITQKMDRSVLTEADLQSHHFIIKALSNLYPSLPLVSEESETRFDFEERQKWERFFLIDPLDGTKEFINRRDEFTVNIALIQGDQPILGVVHIPVLDVTYYAEKSKGAFKIEGDKTIQLQPVEPSFENEVRVIVSRSHRCEMTQHYIDALRATGKKIKEICAGSALKFGLIAEGKADIYPRFSPTMEWDTAAGHILVSEVGRKVRLVSNALECGQECLSYNKMEWLNSGFVVC